MTAPAHRPDGPPRARSVSGLALFVAIIVAACGAAAGSPTPQASGTGTAASGDPGVAPSPTRWPGGVVEAVMNLGKADSEIEAAGADLGTAAASEDLEAMWGAADGLVTLLSRLIPEVDRIKDYPETAPAANALTVAFPEMLAGASELRDGITAGDAARIVTGSQRLATGLEDYRQARRLLGPLVDEAILMQRILVK